MTVVRAAVIQDCPVVFNRTATIEKVHALVQQAADQKAQVVVMPEAFVSAYPVGLDFGARVGLRQPKGRDDFGRYYESALDVPSRDCDALGAAARDAGVYLVIGVIEREGGTLYCTVLFFSPDGKLMGKHRKLMPTAMERLVWGFGDGSTMPVFDTPVGKIGSVICWENYMPMLRMHMYGQGIQLYCAPTADHRDTWLPSMRHIALEGRCFVLTCCQYLTRADCPGDYAAIHGNDPSTVLMRGGSSIIGPLGQVLAGPCFDKPSILFSDLDLDEIPRGKYDMDVVGHYARPDVFRLHVNTRPAPPVVVSSGDLADPFREDK